MQYDLHAALARVAGADLEDSTDTVYASYQAVRQFNALLTAARERYPDSPDIVALATLRPGRREARPGELRDAIQRLRDGLEAVYEPGDADGPMMDRKFGLLRDDPQYALDFEQYAGADEELGLVFLDMDDMKSLNDKYNHQNVDDDVLRPLQQLIQDHVHARGFAYKVGGDEFMVLLRNVDPAETEAFASRLQRIVAEARFSVDEAPEQISVSIGFAHYPSDADSSKGLRDAANDGERQAKRNGGDRVERVRGGDS